MRLEPVEAVGGDWADVEAVDVGGVGELRDPGFVVCDRGADECGADFGNHVRLRALDHAREGEHVFLRDDLLLRRVGVDHHRAEVVAAILLHKAFAEFAGEVSDAGLFEVLLDHVPDGGRDAGRGERGEFGVGVGGGLHFDGADFFGDGLGDFLGMARGPDAGGVDAAAAAVADHAFDHHVEVFFPLVDAVIAEQDFRPPWSVGLDLGVAGVAFAGLRAAEDHAAAAGVQERRADVGAAAGIERHRFGWDAGFDEGVVHAIGRPGFG